MGNGHGAWAMGGIGRVGLRNERTLSTRAARSASRGCRRGPALGAGARARQAQAARQRRRRRRLDVVPRTGSQRHVGGDSTDTHAASTAGVGVSQGHELHLPGDSRRPARVRASRRRRRDRGMPARRNGRVAVAVSLPHQLRRSIRLQQRAAIEPRDRRQPGVHTGRAGTTALLRYRHGHARLASTHQCGVQGAAGFFRHRDDAARGRQTARHQRRRAGRPLRRRARQGVGTRGVAGWQGMGAQLCLSCTRDRPRTAPRLRVRGRRIRSTLGRPVVHRPRQRRGRLHVPVAQPVCTSR